MLNIDRDLQRFREIVKGKVRDDLKKYVSSGELIGKKGKDTVSIPLPQIGVPRLRYGENKSGVGQGEGEGEGAGEGQKAGDKGGEHILEVEISVEDLAKILGEELALPRIEPKGHRQAASTKNKYTGIAPVGPESLRHNKRTYRQALKRSIAAGTYDPNNPRVIPIKEDKRYRTFETQQEPQSAAVIIYMMDVSGSMADEQKAIVRNTAFWLDAWLSHNYDDVATRFIVHDAEAREVDRDTFFRTKESGGTLISSAYTLCQEIIDRDYPVSEWNIYPFHFSDGDNWSESDTKKCEQLLRNKLLAASNQFSYVQVDSRYGSGQFIKDLRTAFPETTTDRLCLARIEDRDGILAAIKTLLVKGR